MPRSANTREDLLRATRELLESTPFASVTVGTVAKRARVSRQAVYLHFRSKTELLLALVDWIDATGRLPVVFRSIAAIADPVERLLALVEGASIYQADIADVALALRAARDTDEAARAAWDDRAARRLASMRGAIQAVADVGRLAPGWTVRSATDVIYAVAGITVYQDLVRERGWSVRRYAGFVQQTIRRLVIAE